MKKKQEINNKRKEIRKKEELDVKDEKKQLKQGDSILSSKFLCQNATCNKHYIALFSFDLIRFS